MADNETPITPEEVKALLTEFVSRERQTYVGMRYVPKFADPIAWDSDTAYEPLTMVTHNDAIYVSKFYVPADVDISETEYWALWGSLGTVDFDTLTDAVRSAYVRTFDTVADMQSATDLLAGMTCHTNGFYASGDGGAAYYTVSASGTANGMDVLALQGGLFATLVVTEPYVSPLMLGAAADGTTDDIAAFNRAIGILNAGQRLYVPSGDYLLGQTLTISKNIDFECDGRILVTHAAPVIVLDGLEGVNFSIDTIEKSARVYDYSEGATNYSIGVIVKNCENCIVNVGGLINVTTGIVLLADNGGCYYNTVSCNEAHTFTGVELIKASAGEAVNGNTVNGFTWMVNTWSDNIGLVPSYMIKSLSYGSTPYVNNGNAFVRLRAEYGARAADYAICLVKLDYATHCTFQFDRIEILPKNGVGFGDSFLFTNSTWCSATVMSVTQGIVAAANVGTGTHNYVYDESELANMGKIVGLLNRIGLHTDVSYTSNWFICIMTPATRIVKIQGELIIGADVAAGTALITNLPKIRAGAGVMKIVMGTTATLWNAPSNVTFHKINCSASGNTTNLITRGALASGLRLYVDIDYFVDDSEL